MEPLNEKARQSVLDIFASVKDMSLATLRPDGYPQATVVSYANDGLTLFIGIGLGGQKACNIQHDARVSLTITPAYPDWRHIKGVSIGAMAEIIHDLEEIEHVSECMLRRFPQLKTLKAGTGLMPWAGAVFVRISPLVLSLLDYEKGFGHTELYAVAAAARAQVGPDER